MFRCLWMMAVTAPIVSSFFLGGGILKWGVERILDDSTLFRKKTHLDEYMPKIDTFSHPQRVYDVHWHVVGVDTEFRKENPNIVKIWNKEYVVWKDRQGKYRAWNDVDADASNASIYDVVVHGGWVWLNTFGKGRCPGVETKRIPFREKEMDSSNFSQTFQSIQIPLDSSGLMEKSLDGKHYGLIYPSITEEPPKELSPIHYRLKSVYESVANSFGKRMFGYPYLIIETEFHLPYTTLLRVMYKDYISTVVMSGLPIGESFSRLWVKTHRNFWRNTFGDWVIERIVRNILLGIRKKVNREEMDQESSLEPSMGWMYRKKYTELEGMKERF